MIQKFDEVNLQLQGANTILVNCKNIVSLFIEKLDLFPYNLLEREFHQFLELSSIKKIM